MKRLLFYSSCILCWLVGTAVTVYPGPTGKIVTGPLPSEVAKANKALRSLITNHPERLVYKELNQWIESGKVKLSIQSDHLPRTMAAEIVNIGGRLEPVLVFNPDFLLNKLADMTADEEEKEKRLVIYHEAVHLDLHFSGKAPLHYGGRNPEDFLAYAHSSWISEKAAVKAEWELAKKWGVEKKFFPSMARSIARSGQELGFLEGFYELIKKHAQRLTSEPGIVLGEWEKIFEQERRQLVSSEKLIEWSANAPLNEFRCRSDGGLTCFTNVNNPDLKPPYLPCLRIGPIYVGQYWHELQKILGKPWEVTRREGHTIKVYPIESHERLKPYWVITQKSGLVEAIQLTGKNPKAIYTFSSIKLGDNTSKVLGILGRPSTTVPVQEIKGVLWLYHPFPISLEIIGEEVYSIRISRIP